MGAFLDSAEDIRQDKKGASGQAHKAEKALEKKEEQGVKWQRKKKHQKLYWKGLM